MKLNSTPYDPVLNLFVFPINRMSQLTTSQGHPVDDNQNSISAGEYGPLVL